MTWGSIRGRLHLLLVKSSALKWKGERSLPPSPVQKWYQYFSFLTQISHIAQSGGPEEEAVPAGTEAGIEAWEKSAASQSSLL